ncbi:TetR/AcrR family transcriptional regulator C-terminal domain-containing protein [Cohnella sp. CBP 2801]|uniref:TetR/AcrR family transcriptional regulator C-terminal domain-containing protein n=1 Tax=Cohnella zeiphila TaxID=2761120 RepID=A0A7X0SR01_9BACL|nr:TetR/AcrR family transcriptional regulator C-terminal domain-containing protein [Cohnella zeiphila]
MARNHREDSSAPFSVGAMDRDEVDRNGKNEGLRDEVILQYVGTAYVGIVEGWITNGMPYPPEVMARQVGTLLERSL